MLRKLHSSREVVRDLYGVILNPQEIKGSRAQGYACGMNEWGLSEVKLGNYVLNCKSSSLCSLNTRCLIAGIVRDVTTWSVWSRCRGSISAEWAVVWGSVCRCRGSLLRAYRKLCRAVFSRSRPDANVPVQCGFRHTGRITLCQFKVGAGLGLR